MTATALTAKRTARAAAAARKLDEAPKLEWQTVWDIVEAVSSENHEPKSRNSLTYSSIKRIILFGQLGPGRKLVHEELAEALDVSRTPVREALERLYQEGFVTRLPRRGFYVTGITREEAYGLYGAREALEMFALQVTLERGPLPRKALNMLAAYAARYEELVNTQMMTEHILADALFHLKLAELSGESIRRPPTRTDPGAFGTEASSRGLPLRSKQARGRRTQAAAGGAREARQAFGLTDPPQARAVGARRPALAALRSAAVALRSDLTCWFFTHRVAEYPRSVRPGRTRQPLWCRG